ncbi:thiamine phosphate synthase [Suttonella sp. R2A3]|uniref:thiamine phosphate synthase n=1 Tax=Suttonella sp. R2A3 TaxID=2908648 RepID=UPI001F380382|nr:thiamine phosphate synthase [Suttonella sp. R2A3]UJF25010.1 thiamine phosphate synthase [Suttonella sp. R2A3]
MVIDLSLYLVLDAAVCGSRERLIDTAKLALNAGVSVLQLRGHKTAWSRRDWYEVALALKPLCAAARVPLIINDQLDIALAVDADGLHIGQDDLPVAVARRLLGKDKILGLSTHNSHEAQAADPAVVNYIGMGPVYSTSSKADAKPALGLDGLAELVAVKRVPGVAIGGINAERASAVRQVNPQGIAVISAICGQDNIPAAVAALRA